MQNDKNIANLESRIGLYWLHRLGIVTLVFGIVFLITYSIQLSTNPLLMPLFKLTIGMAVSMILLLLGKRMSVKEKEQWYGHGLTAGGWSLAYFTTYAAYYIQDVKLIHSLPLETLLLSVVALGSLWSALRARSELMAIYSFSLASATIIMNGPSLISDISFVIIALAASVLGNRQGWRALLAFALASCYIGHFSCLGSHLTLGEAGISAAFLSILWLIFGAGIGYSSDIPDKAKRFMTVLACINGLVFAAGLAWLNLILPVHVGEAVFVLTGIIYLATARWLTVRKQEQLSILHSLLGLFLINAAKCMHFSGLEFLAVDILQIALLAVVGSKFNIRPFSWVSMILAVLFMPIWLACSMFHFSEVEYGIAAFRHVQLGLFAVSVFGSLAYYQHRISESRVNKYIYHIVANILAGLIVLFFKDVSWQTFGFVLISVANCIVAARINSMKVAENPGLLVAEDQPNYFATFALIPFAISVLLATYNLNNWGSLPMALSTIGLFSVFGFSHCIDEEGRASVLNLVHWVFAYAATIVLTLLVLLNVAPSYVSLALGIEGFTFLCAGFLMKEKFFRLSGLSMLGLLSSKLLFFDLANHNTLERILSFIAAGIIFLLASYVYGRFTQVFGDELQDEIKPEDFHREVSDNA